MSRPGSGAGGFAPQQQQSGPWKLQPGDGYGGSSSSMSSIRMPPGALQVHIGSAAPAGGLDHEWGPHGRGSVLLRGQVRTGI
jgi:hypothetical protein